MMESVLSASARYPKDPAFQPSYGTAGFRAEASLLASTMFRCGIIAALRSRQAGQAVGVMVTASHNPERDNGVKIVEPNGEYLHRQWEEHATAAAIVETDAGLVEQVERIVAEETIAPGPCKVLVGHDTRPSCPALVRAVQDGVAAVGGEVVDCGLQTTPQLHFRVWSLNRGEAWTESEYYRVLIAGYKAFAGAGGATSSPLVVDCANGIGGVKLQEMLEAGLDQAGIQLQLRNTGAGPLNDGCGSDYVQKERQLPAGFQDLEVGTR